MDLCYTIHLGNGQDVRAKHIRIKDGDILRLGGELDVGTLESLAEYYREIGIKVLIVCGDESLERLTEDQKKSMLDFLQK